MSDRLMSGSTSWPCVDSGPRRGRGSSRNRHPLHDVVDHRFGRQAVAGRVRPEPDAVAEDVRRQILNVFRIDLVAAAHEQRPGLGETAPADDGARRRAEVDAAFDELGRRVRAPVDLGVVRPRRRHQALDVVAKRLVQKHVLVDRPAQLDDALLRHQLVRAECA